MKPLRLYFDTRPWDDFHRQKWAQRLGQLAASDSAQVAADPAEADLIIDVTGRHGLEGGRALEWSPPDRTVDRPERIFEWDASDFPSGRLPGLYCSLSKRLFDPSRHRGFCYPWRYNDAVSERPQDEVTHLYGFSGGMSSPLRHRLLEALSSEPAGLLRRADNIWGRILAGEPDTAKEEYAKDLARVKFVLCPRGNGLSSIRLFEAMEAGRVPVILSDNLVLPHCVPWDQCSVRIAERDLARIPQILAERAADWPRLAREARRQWEDNFSDRRLLTTLAAECAALLELRRQRPAKWFVLARILPDWTLFRAKSLRRRLQQRLRK